MYGSVISNTVPTGEWKYVNNELFIALLTSHNSPINRIDDNYTLQDFEFKVWLRLDDHLRREKLLDVI